jgi:hypothetical protein
MGYRLIVRRGRYKEELRIEMKGAKKKKWREVRRESRCVGGGESSNRMRGGTNEPSRYELHGKSQIRESNYVI